MQTSASIQTRSNLPKFQKLAGLKWQRDGECGFSILFSFPHLQSSFPLGGLLPLQSFVAFIRFSDRIGSGFIRVADRIGSDRHQAGDPRERPSKGPFRAVSSAKGRPYWAPAKSRRNLIDSYSLWHRSVHLDRVFRLCWIPVTFSLNSGNSGI